MLSNGCGEFSGTSMTVTPASISASPMRIDLVRLHAAQDRGDRALSKGGAQVEHRVV